VNINQLRESKYLKKEDCDTGILVTIKSLKEQNVAKEDQPAEMKHVLYFEEEEKGLVLNSTNAQLIAAITKSEETDDWDGKQIVLFNDPSVSYAGKITGGIRVRAPRIKGKVDEAPF